MPTAPSHEPRPALTDAVAPPAPAAGAVAAEDCPEAASSPDEAPGDESPVEEPERGPLRRCLVTREVLPKERMIRFVLDPDRALVPDLEGRLPGRGMWLSARADVLERAVKRGAFSRAARASVSAPPDLRARIEDGLRRRVRDLVGFARRSGQAVCGWQAVREWLQAGRVGLLVEASDGSPAERARLIGGRLPPVVTPLTSDALGGIFGREHAVHVAVAPGRLAGSIAVEAARLSGVADASRTMDGMTGGMPRRGAAGD